MSGLFSKKIDQQPKFEMPPVKIPYLNAYFDPITGKWIDYTNMQSEDLLNQSRSTLDSLSKQKEKLEDGLARKLISLENVKKEILMILQDHKDLLSPQGLDTDSLIKSLTTP